MANQPFDSGIWTHITGTAAGTTNVKQTNGNLYRVIVPANKTGTASFYDQAAGSSAGAHMFDLPNTVGSIPTAIEVGARLRYGLTVVVGGTVDFTVVYE